jgi:hypothetical protein
MADIDSDAGDGGQNSAGDGAAASLSEAQINQVAEIVNKAISKRTKGLDDKLTTQVASQLSEFKDALTTSVGELLEKSQQGGDGSGKDPKDGGDVEKDPKFVGLQKQVSKLEKALETANAQTEQERKTARGAKLRSSLVDALAAHKIDGTNATHAVGHLVDSAKRVRYEEDEIVFVDEDGDAVPLKSGLADWVKTPDAKLYQAPTGASGSGKRSTGNGSGSPGGNNAQNAYQKTGERLVDAIRGGAIE